MAVNACLRIKGQKQGDLHGTVTLKGQEGSIVVHSFTHEIDSPRDAQSGLPTGKRMHKPMTIVKDIDGSSPLLWQALVTNENLTLWQLRLWQTVPGGGREGVLLDCPDQCVDCVDPGVYGGCAVGWECGSVATGGDFVYLPEDQLGLDEWWGECGG